MASTTTSSAGSPGPATLPQAAELARRFQALADEKRVRVLDVLRDGEHCVCDLTEALDVSQSLLSFHLKTLKDAGLVTDRRQGRWSYYALVPEALAELKAVLDALHGDAEACRADGVAKCCG